MEHARAMYVMVVDTGSRVALNVSLIVASPPAYYRLHPAPTHRGAIMPKITRRVGLWLQLVTSHLGDKPSGRQPINQAEFF